MKQRYVILSLITVTVLSLSLWVGNIRADAQSWVQGFLRAADGSLLVTCTLGTCGSTVPFDSVTCTNSTATTCTATTTNTYPANTPCNSQDSNVNDTVNSTCSVTGTTMTITTTQTTVSRSCTMAAATTCAITLPYTASTATDCAIGLVQNASPTVFGAWTGAGTALTVEASAANSQAWRLVCDVKNPSATGHTFNGVVIL